MKNGVNGHAMVDSSYKQINDRLEQIAQYMRQEVDCKQQTIEEQRREIEVLREMLNDKNALMAAMQQQLSQSAQHTEGHRQLINKLLNDIEHFQNDIDWYKRTYERRSIWGVLKEKLTRKKQPGS